MRLDKAFEFPDHISRITGFELTLDAVLHGPHPQLLEPSRLHPQHLDVIGQIPERRPPPHLQRTAQLAHPGIDISTNQLPGLAYPGREIK